MQDPKETCRETEAILREALAKKTALTERRMMGGLCVMLNGHMLCGAHGPKQAGGAMLRVGKAREAEALTMDGVVPMTMTGRRMGGFVDLDAEAVRDPARLAPLLALAVAYVESLPPK